MRPDISSLALFIRVAELKSITKAAAASHIALAALSRRISQLEEQFGVQLLHRSARGVELTPAGTALLFHARQMMEKVDAMRAEISDYSKGAKGLVRVQVKSFDVVARMVQAGLGIGVLPEAAAKAFGRAMGLRFVSLTDPWAARKMYVCVREYASLPASARQLVDDLTANAAA